jgi:hypothetical protein
MSSQCQASTIKSVQCKRKISTGAFCKQHQSQSFSIVNESIPEKQTSIVHVQRAFVSLIIKQQKQHPEQLCDFRNACSENVCHNEKSIEHSFCEHHQTHFRNHEMLFNHFIFRTEILQFESGFLHSRIHDVLGFMRNLNNKSHELVQFSNVNNSNALLNLLEFVSKRLHDVATSSWFNMSEKLFELSFKDELNELQSFRKTFNIATRIQIEKNKRKIEIIKVQMLSEICIRDPQNSNALQCVFTKDICEKIVSFL